MPARILAFAGSLRKDSFNKKLIHVAVDGARPPSDSTVSAVKLVDYVRAWAKR